jgi:AraC family transcriptional regulator
MAHRPDNLAEYRRRVRVVQDHIARHLSESPDLDALARLAHFSPFHFHRIFRGVTGQPLHAYIRILRLERAARDLSIRTDSVLSIALHAGYDSHEAFSRAFRDHFGITPSQHRRGEPPHPPRPRPTPGTIPMNVQIVTVEPMLVASVRHVGPYGSPTIRNTWSTLCRWAAARGLLNQTTKCYGIGHDDPDSTPPDKIRYDACITVAEGTRAEGDVSIQTIAGGRCATTRHTGPHERLQQTYSALFGQWLPESGEEPADAPPFEHYVNTPDRTPPEQLITDIYVPLLARRA